MSWRVLFNFGGLIACVGDQCDQCDLLLDTLLEPRDYACCIGRGDAWSE